MPKKKSSVPVKRAKAREPAVGKETTPSTSGARLSVPLYVCPMGDQASTTAGVCPNHNVPMVRIDPERGAGKQSIMAAPLFVCPRGDQSSTTESICSVHLVPMIRVGG